MFGKGQLSHWLLGLGLLAAVGGLSVLAPRLRFTTPAQAQWRDDRYPFLNRPHQRQQRSSGGGFFEDLFGGGHNRRGWFRRRAPAQAQPREHIDYSRAPPPHKPAANAEPPTTTIVVMGDGMADWLAYGLEDTFADSPDVAIVRQDQRHSGLIRYKWHSDLDWWHVARDDLAKEKADYVVMMIGINDRRNISARNLAKQFEKERQEKQAKLAKQQKNKPLDLKSQSQGGKKTAEPSIVAPEPKPVPHHTVEFRSDEWAKIYAHRIDETIAALKSKGVPVFWVGLPSIRGTRSTANAVYLNDLFRARADRAGIDYIDIWDGFVDDNGKYSSYGPDYEGQTRRLRSRDGVYFTKYGARKLAHYVEREIRRYMNNRAVVSLPSGPIGRLPGGKSAVRPLVGPVIPLTVAPSNANVLAGGPGMRPAPDPIATKVLVKGDALQAPPGRADDFAWPPGSDANKKPAQAAKAPAAPAAAVANVAPTAAPVAPRAPVAAKPLPPPRPEAKQPAALKPAEVNKPVAARKPARSEKPVAARKPARVEQPVAARRPAEHKRRPAERTAERAPHGLLPPASIPNRSTHRRARHRSNSLFGPNGPFGWLH